MIFCDTFLRIFQNLRNAPCWGAGAAGGVAAQLSKREDSRSGHGHDSRRWMATGLPRARPEANAGEEDPQRLKRGNDFKIVLCVMQVILRDA